jgi:TDG/mug DNA glycosylase family protein
MKTEQLNLRLEADLVAQLEEAAGEESLDRGTMVRKLLWEALRHRRLERALEGYRRGEVSVGRAAADSGLTHWEILEQIRRRGIAYPLEAEEVEARLESLAHKRPRVAEAGPTYRARRASIETLPDRPPGPGGVLLVGINPAPASVLAGHYYQGRIGRRLWKRLARIGLFRDARPGAEDEAFVAAGHGLTDIVKRPTASASELVPDEIERGVEGLREKVRAWRPGLVLFVFTLAARSAIGDNRLAPGRGPLFEEVPTFLLSGPYAPQDKADRIDRELREWLSTRSGRAARRKR